jgi:hypothetical protein
MTMQPDALALLESDHRALLRLFAEYADMLRHGVPAQRRQALAERACTELAIHQRLKEEIFHPAARAALHDDDLMDDSVQQHEAIADLVAQVLAARADDALYDARVVTLGDHVRRHVVQEREQVFARLGRSAFDARALGRQLAQRKQELHTVAEALREDVLASALL